MTAPGSRETVSWPIWRLGLWALVAAAALVLVGLGGYTLGRQGGRQGEWQGAGEQKLPVLGLAPNYSFTNQLGQRVGSRQFRGKVQIVAFIDPYCTQFCPLVAAHLVNLENFGLIPAHIENRVQIVSFDLRPKRTGAPQLRAFLKEYGWNPSDLHWQFLTGPPETIRKIVQQGFHVWYKRVPIAAEGQNNENQKTKNQKTAGPQMVQPEIVNKLAEKAASRFEIAHNDVVEIVDQRGRVRKLWDNADVVGWQNILRPVQALAG